MFEKKDSKENKWVSTSNRDFWRVVSRNKHVMQVYDDEQTLINSLNRFTRSALSNGEPAVVVATAQHLQGLSRSLQLLGIDTDALRFGRDLVFIEADAMLSEFMVDDYPDEMKFSEALNRVLGAAGISEFSPASIYGEMVALLLERGRKEATIALEEMWNRVCIDRKLTLFCAYPRCLFCAEGSDDIIHICAQHASLIDGGRSLTEIRFRHV